MWTPTHSHPDGTMWSRTFLLVLLYATSGWAQNLSPTAARLREFGIAPDEASIAEYLRSLHPDEASLVRIRKLIGQLGDADFFRREAATNELLRLPVQSTELLEKAAAGSDLETRWRAKQVLKLGKNRLQSVLFAVFDHIKQKKLDHSLAQPTLEALPFCAGSYLQRRAHAAVKAIVQDEDAPMLRRMLAHNSIDVRVAAIVALEHLQEDGADDVLAPLLSAEQERIRLTAARALVNHGARAGLPVLGTLLQSETVAVRSSAAQALRGVTGQRFGFVPYDGADQRAKSVKAWDEWLTAQGKTAKLTFPLDEEPILLGRTLYANYSQGKVTETDSTGKEVWTLSVRYPYRVQGLPNGHRIIAVYSARTIFEYDTEGKVVWSKVLPGSPYSVQRLPNGNTLVACSNAKLIEYRPDKTIAWELSVTGIPRDAVRLENGNTLVALYSARRVVEYDTKGKEVWSVANMQRPIRAHRTESGTTVICQYSTRTITEVDRAGKTLSSKRVNSTIYDMQRMRNGRTLVVTSSGWEEFDNKWASVGSKRVVGLRAACRY